jgi:glycosyltransferase involved in cell wall biosynthesis
MILPKTNDADYFQAIKTKAIAIDNLDFSGYIPYDEIQHYFDMAKVFVNTSFSEGFPNTFLQAAIAKTPLLSLHINPDNFIDKYNCGFYCAGDEQVLIQNLHKLLNNKTQWQEKSNNIYEYVKKKHDISNNINILKEKIYHL